ncbi:hypothetical protein HU200_015725 [Digitaria exilis]|uniref:DUF1618 domain-containing protein n=1 Tax=Digitaria exilis TaxID=1010633 RepID=A0A835KK20_9POAL|nr:hypothetical protein HU200_015725 [Digitaria exilis]
MAALHWPQTQPGEHPGVSPAAAGSRWVMLSTDDIRLSDTVAEAKTVAESTTSRGRGFRISADLAAPPSSSFLCYDGEGNDDDPDAVVAAQGDSVLLGLRHYPGNSPDRFEYFVYRAAAAGRPPFVSIVPRLHSSHAFAVTTWTMSLSMDEKTKWVMDGVLECEELWDLPGYEGLPCVPPGCPVVSPANSDIIVSNRCLLGFDVKEKVWMLEVDTRRKTRSSSLAWLLLWAQASKAPIQILQQLAFPCYGQIMQILQGLLPDVPQESIADVSKPYITLEECNDSDDDDEDDKDERLTCDIEALMSRGV